MLDSLEFTGKSEVFDFFFFSTAFRRTKFSLVLKKTNCFVAV